MSVASPCINVCRMNADSGLCEGCFRTLDEIARWSGHDDPTRLRILAAVDRRRDVRIEADPVTTDAVDR